MPLQCKTTISCDVDGCREEEMTPHFVPIKEVHSRFLGWARVIVGDDTIKYLCPKHAKEIKFYEV